MQRPCTRNSDPRSAFSKMDTFWSILWHRVRTSSSLQMSFTWRGERSSIIAGTTDRWLNNFKFRNLVGDVCGVFADNNVNGRNNRAIKHRLFTELCQHEYRDSRKTIDLISNGLGFQY